MSAGALRYPRSSLMMLNDDLDEAVRTLHARLPEFRFHQTSEVQVVGDAARVSWGLGPDGEPARVTGIDVIKVRDGRVALLMTFLDNSVVASPDLHTNK
jgi:ketosteroid isomerase-like protein